MSFPELWNGGILEIWSSKRPDLPPLLKDVYPNKQGLQPALGLTTMGNAKKIQLQVIHSETADNIRVAKEALDHEFGHYYCDLCEIGENKQGIYKLLTDEFERIRPHQGANFYEDFAEVYRAILGFDSHKNKFSDNKTYNPPLVMKTYLKTAYWLSQTLAYNDVYDLKFFNGWCRWKQKQGLWWWSSYTEYALTEHWDRFINKNGKWEQI